MWLDLLKIINFDLKRFTLVLKRELEKIKSPTFYYHTPQLLLKITNSTSLILH